MGSIKHEILTQDYLPTAGSGVLSFIGGRILIEGQEHPLNFTQVFVLQPGGALGYYCLNDVFRLTFAG